MHEHIEVIIPPNEDVEKAVEKVMAPFDEKSEDAPHPWWDFYVIGGRWSGQKLIQQLGEGHVDAFQEELQRRGTTVSGIQFGKPELSPSSQIPEIDRLWKEWFPEWTGEHCPLFQHYNDQYQNTPVYGDVMPIRDVRYPLTCEKVLIAEYGFRGELDAGFLVQGEIWNGCNHEATEWDGTLGHALKMHRERLEKMAERYRENNEVTLDWQAVTVDIHH